MFKWIKLAKILDFINKCVMQNNMNYNKLDWLFGIKQRAVSSNNTRVVDAIWGGQGTLSSVFVLAQTNKVV